MMKNGEGGKKQFMELSEETVAVLSNNDQDHQLQSIFLLLQMIYEAFRQRNTQIQKSYSSSSKQSIYRRCESQLLRWESFRGFPITFTPSSFTPHYE